MAGGLIVGLQRVIMHNMSTTWVPADTFGTRLMLLRRHLDLTVEQAAERAGLSHATWSTWERGAMPRNLPSVVTAVVEAFGVDREWLLWGELARTQPPTPGGRRAGRSGKRGGSADTGQYPVGIRPSSSLTVTTQVRAA